MLEFAKQLATRKFLPHRKSMLQVAVPYISLWDSTVPLAVGNEIDDQPAFSVHLPPKDTPRNGCAVLVCPGGGYRVLASDHEGIQVATRLAACGIVAYVLRYRLGPKYHSSTSLVDAQRALRRIRHDASAHDVDRTRVGMLGFSAGGHLTLNAGTTTDAVALDADDPIDQQSSRPDFLVAAYPVSNGEIRGRKASEYTATDTKVTAETPPTFLMHTHEDAVVPANQSLLFYQACLTQGVQAELHVWGRGEHGIGLGDGDPDVATWFDTLVAWLSRNAFLHGGPRVELKMDLRQFFDNDLPGMLWVTLTPLYGGPNVRRRVGSGELAEVSFTGSNAPTTGLHHLDLKTVSANDGFDSSGEYTMSEPVVSRRLLTIDKLGNWELLQRNDD